VALALVGLGAAVGRWSVGEPDEPRDQAVESCASPAGMSHQRLSDRDRSWLLRRTVACLDLQAGRLDLRSWRAAGAALDEPPRPTASTVLWADHVRAVSSEYSPTDWSAARALGRPDARQGADDVNAWASMGADDQVEFLEVGFAEARRWSAVEVLESFNPGAVTALELIDARGVRTMVPLVRATRDTAGRARAELGCTAEPVVAVRVIVDSPRVVGWNEIDAIGAEPCD
jgi:hypothetical protein